MLIEKKKPGRSIITIFILMMFVAGVHAQSGIYKLSPEDVLQISVWKEEGLTQQVIVRPDGRLSFPLVGHINAEGRSLEEVQEIVTQKLKKYIPQPVVTVTLKSVAGNKIFVIGKVTRPGAFTVGRHIDVLQALTLAGGLTPFAQKSKIKIIRREGGKQKVFRFHYSDAASGKDLKQNIILKGGDTVVVN